MTFLKQPKQETSPGKKLLIFIGVVALVIMIGSALSNNDEIKESATETISVKPYQYTPPLDPNPTPTESFSGNGQQVTPCFRLTAGRAIFRMTHTGSRHFAIWLEDDTADLVDLLVNEIGTFNGSTSVHIENTGWFMLDISADGAWTVTIES